MITLVIIGVIAAITIPAIIAKYHDEQLKTQIKKSYSTLSNALNSTVTDFGYLPNCYWSDYTGGSSSECEIFIKAFIKKMNVMKYCENNSINQGCIPEFTTYASGNEGNCSTSFNKANLNNYRAAVLGDGSILFWAGYSFILYVDVNGFKGPNTPGKDVFGILIKQPRRYEKQLALKGHVCIPGPIFDDVLKDLYK